MNTGSEENGEYLENAVKVGLLTGLAGLVAGSVIGLSLGDALSNYPMIYGAPEPAKQILYYSLVVGGAISVGLPCALAGGGATLVGQYFVGD